MDDQLMFFDDEVAITTEKPVWRVLVIDADVDFQRATAFALSGLEVLGRRIELQQAFSYREASMLLTKEQDIALILLDVMMPACAWSRPCAG